MAGHEMEEIERLLQAAGVSWETVVSAMDDSLTGDEDVLARSTLGQVISALARLGRIGHAARGVPIAWSWDGLAGWGAPAGTITHVGPVWIEDETDRPSGWAVQTRAGDTPDDPGEAVWIPWSIVEAVARPDHPPGAIRS